MNEQKPDIVDRALADLLAAPGFDKPPAEVTEQILSAIRDRQSAPQPRRQAPPSFRQQIAWLPLSACVAVMVIGSWFAGFHDAWLSQVAGRRVHSDGTVWVLYTDGRAVPQSSS